MKGRSLNGCVGDIRKKSGGTDPNASEKNANKAAIRSLGKFVSFASSSALKTKQAFPIRLKIQPEMAILICEVAFEGDNLLSCVTISVESDADNFPCRAIFTSFFSFSIALLPSSNRLNTFRL